MSRAMDYLNRKLLNEENTQLKIGDKVILKNKTELDYGQGEYINGTVQSTCVRYGDDDKECEKWCLVYFPGNRMTVKVLKSDLLKVQNKQYFSANDFMKENNITKDQFDKIFSIAEQPISDKEVKKKVSKMVGNKVAEEFIRYLS